MAAKRRRRKLPTTPMQHAKFERVLHEFHHNRLRTADGKKVKSAKQAVAIALSEAEKV